MTATTRTPSRIGRKPGSIARSMRLPRRKATDLDLRRTPLQSRGQATFERILDATARLLDEVPTEAITTNLMAKAAGINVATLYQYFPNKQAVMLALFERQSDLRISTGVGAITGLGSSPNWPRMLDDAIDAVVQLRRSQPGAVALRQAMRSSPDLLEYDLRGTRHAAAALATELQQAAPRIPREEIAVVARCAMETVATLLDYWAISTRQKDERIVAQLKVLVRGYLAQYLPAPAKSGKRR